MRKMISATGNIIGCSCLIYQASLYSPINWATTRRQGMSCNRGFTLVEMLVVLAIIAMLLGISIPFTSGFGKGLRIKTTARAISGILHVARSNAITFRKSYSVIFDVQKGQYWIEDLQGSIYEKKYCLPSSVEFKIKGDEKADPVTFENDRVTFYPTGAIEQNSGSVTFTDKQGDSKTISVTGSTGKITID